MPTAQHAQMEVTAQPTYVNGNDVAGGRHHGDAHLVQARLEAAHVFALAIALSLAGLQVLHRRQGTGNHGRGQRRGENQASAVRAHHVHQLVRPGNVAANHTVGLAQRASDNVELAPVREERREGRRQGVRK